MADDHTNRPVETLRDGAVKASIWENEGPKGKFHSVTFARTYKDQNGQISDTGRFSGTDLLKLSKLAGQSYDAVNQRREKEREQQPSQAYADQQRGNARQNNDRAPDRGDR